MTIEAGRWYRTPEGHAGRAGERWLDRWRVTYTDNSRWTWPAEQLTPWVPKVGEWIRGGGATFRAEAVYDHFVNGTDHNGNRCGGPLGWFEPCLPPAEKNSAVPWVPKVVGEWVRAVRPTFHDGPFRVISVSASDLADEPWVEVANANGFRLTARANLFEPCLPPAGEKISAVQMTTTTTWNEAGGAIVPESVRVEADESEVIDYNGACPKCGGPAYVGLNDAECLAEKCERVEPGPMVCRSWFGFCRPPDPDGAVRWEVPEWHAGAEPIWTAHGLGLSVNHPIREEAIRLWREAVRRG